MRPGLEAWRADIEGLGRGIPGFPFSVGVGTPVGGSLASICGSRITVSERALGLPDDARRYICAHELGHAAGRHSLMTSSAFPAGAVSWAIGLEAGFPLAGAALMLAGTAISMAHLLTMAFEYSADRAGARLIGTEAMVAGIRSLERLGLISPAGAEMKARALLGGRRAPFKPK